MSVSVDYDSSESVITTVVGTILGTTTIYKIYSVVRKSNVLSVRIMDME